MLLFFELKRKSVWRGETAVVREDCEWYRQDVKIRTQEGGEMHSEKISSREKILIEIRKKACYNVPSEL